MNDIVKHSLSKHDIKILLLEGVHESAVEALRQNGYTNIEYHDKSLPEDDLIERLQDAYMVGIRSRTQLTDKVLNEARKLIAVGCFCIGTNQVDLVTAAGKGVPVFNAPFSNTRSVAELIIAETIMLLRGIPEKNALAHRGGWLKSASGSYEARGKRLGIIGYGHIGTQVGVLAESLGMQVLFYDVESKLALGNATAVRSLDELLAMSDVVTLHVPETPNTRMMIGATEIARMRPGTLLINASRGTVVDIEALADALARQHLAGAAIDVFPTEPKSNKDPFESSLLRFDNTILTPHIGGSTVEAQQNIGLEVAEKLIRYSDNGSTMASVNFPEVSLPPHPGSHRLLHIHRNQPGILYNINAIFSDQSINIAAQYLQTRENIGYVVIDLDVDETVAHRVLQQLKSVEGTLRARILY